MQALIVIIHVLAAIAIIILVLLQHGKGADAGAAFGSGASSTMFGSAGSMSFFMKLTALLAAVFFTTSLTLSYLASHRQPRPLQLLNAPASMAPAPVAPAQPPVQTQPAQPLKPAAPVSK
jgi:preprotein translocase subunit SecG